MFRKGALPLMYYPLRRMRRRQSLLYAKMRLRTQFFRITEKKQSRCLKQPQAVRHVQFTGKIRVITFAKGVCAERGAE